MNIDLNELTDIWKLNVNAHGRMRHGWARAYSPTISGQECVGIAPLHYANTWPGSVDTSAILAVWADGKTTLNGGATLGTVSVSLPRWVNILPVTIYGYNTSTSAWAEKNVAIINSDTNNYIFDPKKPDGSTYLYPYTLTTPSAVTNGGEVAGDIPAGTYKYVITEVSYFGQESLKSASLTVTSVTDFKVTLNRPAMANTSTAFWRVYRSLESDTTGNETYSWVADVVATTTTYLDNKLVQNLGLPYDIQRIATPATCKFSTMHLNSMVSSGNAAESTKLYFEDVTLATSGFVRSGYPEIGCTKFAQQIPEASEVVAIQSYKNMLFAFTKNSIWALHEKPWDKAAWWRKVTSDVGTSNFRTVVQYNGMLYFMDADKANLWMTDGYELVRLNKEHAMAEVFYHLSGLQTGNNRHSLQGGWTAEVVFADPMHDEVYFGGEIATDAYVNTADVIRGVWSAAAAAANPQSNRQYFWWVWHVTAKKLTPYTNIPVKCACTLDGVVYFGDDLQYIDSMKRDESADGLSTKSCLVSTLTAGTGTTISWTGNWSGTHVPHVPVTIYRTDGTTQLVYSRAGGTVASVVVDKSITVTADDRLTYGVVVSDTWVPIANDAVYVAEIEWLVEPFSVRGYCNMLGLWRGNQSVATWTKIIDWTPMSLAYAKAYIGYQGITPLMRLILPAIYGLGTVHETPFSGYIATLNVNAFKLDGGRW